MENSNTSPDPNRISPTAKLTAYWRAQSRMAYAAEIAEAVGAEQTAKKMMGAGVPEMTAFSVLSIVARYRSVNFALKESGLTNVLELACGLSPRGLEIARDQGIYVGTDLPGISEETFPVFRKIASREKISEANLHYRVVNAMEADQLETAAAVFNAEPLAICNEGLLMYLSKEEKEIVAQNIRKVLLCHGGVWITPDIAFHEILFHAIRSDAAGAAIRKNAESRLKGVSEMTGRNFMDNYFHDEGEAVQFYKRLGFTLREFPMWNENDTLPSVPVLQEYSKPMMLRLLSLAKVWILKPVP